MNAHDAAEDALFIIERAARAGIVHLDEVDDLDRSGGDLNALAASLRRTPGRHRRRLAGALEALTAGSRIEGPVYALLAKDRGERFNLRRSMIDGEMILALPDFDPAAPPTLESEKKRLVRSLRVRLWRERLEAVPVESDEFRIVDRDDPGWKHSVVMRWSRRGRSGEMMLCRGRR